MIHYDFNKNEYNVNKPINPSKTGEEASEDSVSGEFAPTSAEDSSGAAQGQITPTKVHRKVSSYAAESEIPFCTTNYMKFGERIPDNINEVLNSKDLDTKLNNALKHQFWKKQLNPSV